MGRFAWVMVAAILLTFSVANAEWYWQNPLPQGVTLTSVCFRDSLHGWTVGRDKLIHTTDGGASWHSELVWMQHYWGQVLFTPNGTGWLAGKSVKRSLDGGETWESAPGVPDSIEPAGLFFLDDLNGWVIRREQGGSFHTSDGGVTWNLLPEVGGGDSALPAPFTFSTPLHGWMASPIWGPILESTDGGASWTERPDLGSRDVKGIEFVDSIHGWIYGGNILRTTDGGVTWAVYASVFCQEASFTDTLNGWMVSGGSTYRSRNGGVTWIQQFAGHPDDRNNLFDVSFRDSLHGWTVGGAGLMLSTADGGTTWSLRTRGSRLPLHDITFADTLHGWAVGDSGIVLRTVNGGGEWTTHAVGTVQNLHCVTFTDTMIGWAGAANGWLFQTGDGGETWTQHIVPPGGPFVRIVFADAEHGWAAQQSRIVRTVDGGATWTTSLVVEGIQGLSFVSATEGWTTMAHVISHTVDGGDTWETMPFFTPWTLTDICFVTPLTGWLGENGGGWSSFPKTSDGGVTWYPQWYDGTRIRRIVFRDSLYGWATGEGLNGGTGKAIACTRDGVEWHSDRVDFIGEGIAAPDNEHVWVCGGNGAILSNHPTPVLPASRPKIVTPSAYALAVYPNPFNPVAMLEFELPMAGMVNLSVYDVTGRLVETLNPGVTPAGSHTIRFDGSQLSSGVYFARLESGSFSVTRKLILMK